MINQDQSPGEEPSPLVKDLLKTVIKNACKEGERFSTDQEIINYIQREKGLEGLCRKEHGTLRLELYMELRDKHQSITTNATAPTTAPGAQPTPPPDNVQNGEHLAPDDGSSKPAVTFSQTDKLMQGSIHPYGTTAPGWQGVTLRKCQQSSNSIRKSVVSRMGIPAADGEECVCSWYTRAIDHRSRLSRFTVLPDHDLPCDIALGTGSDDDMEPEALEAARGQTSEQIQFRKQHDQSSPQVPDSLVPTSDIAMIAAATVDAAVSAVVKASNEANIKTALELILPMILNDDEMAGLDSRDSRREARVRSPPLIERGSPASQRKRSAAEPLTARGPKKAALN